MSSRLELAANAVNAISILLAMLNSVHTWWLGIVGCTLFGWLFFDAQLYADVTLQAFFIGTSVVGWRAWLHGNEGHELPISRSSQRTIAISACIAAAVAVGYGSLLHGLTDAYAPYLDSIVLAFSVLAQLLLMRRRVETWWCWLIVNTVAVPLFASRGLYVTALLYAAFWINACVALIRWRHILERDACVEVATIPA
jgi:nicotinamide mononucleotide transporter